MVGNIDYKKLWFELCEEKKQLQLENHRLNKDSLYYRNKFESLERVHAKFSQNR